MSESVSSTVAPRNGGRPVNNSYKIAPKEYTSVRRPGRLRAADRLFRRHIARRSQHGVFGGKQIVARSEFSQTKIGDTYLLRGRNQHIRGLQVTVQNSRVMNHVHCFGQRQHQPCRLIGCERLACREFFKRRSIDEFHHEVQATIVVYDLVHVDDVGVALNGQGFRLPAVGARAASDRRPASATP